jgi:cell division protein FtsZ
MTLNLNIPSSNPDLTPKITVIGVGGAGGNAVNNMIQSKLEGVEFLVANTDAQALQQSMCDRRTQLGRNITQGLGAGSRPDIGRAAAEEALDEILNDIDGQHMVFVTAGMGGGTGTGAAPVIARAAREAGLLTVGVVTKPFHFEGVHRMRLAEAGITELTQYVDTLIIIPNQNLFRVANEKTTFADAFKMADDVLESGVRGVTDLMVNPGLINLDFADIRSVMSEMGKAMMGTGEAEGDNRAIEAAEAAISNPLLDDVSMKGARGVLINISGGTDLTLFEVDEAANRIRDEVDPEANIIFGSTFNDAMENRMRVSVVATGIEAEQSQGVRPVSFSVVGAESAPRPAETSAPPAPAASTASGRSFFAAAATAEAIAIGAEEDDEQAYVSERTEPLTEAMRPSVEIEMAEAPSAEVAEEAAQPWPLDEAVQEARPAAAEPMQPEAEASGEPEAGESFFAPPPAEADAAPVEPTHEPARPEPFAEADLANAAQPRADKGALRRSGSSIFARVTGAARAIQAATAGGGEAEAQAARPAPEAREPMLTPAQPRRTEEQAVEEAPKAAPQLRLTGLDAAEKVRTAEAEEDLLDIPAFLRRQAN